MSPEAEVARDAHRSIGGDPNRALVRCASRRDLIAAGYPDDVEVAAEISPPIWDRRAPVACPDASDAVPVMIDAGFVCVRSS